MGWCPPLCWSKMLDIYLSLSFLKFYTHLSLHYLALSHRCLHLPYLFPTTCLSYSTLPFLSLHNLSCSCISSYRIVDCLAWWHFTVEPILQGEPGNSVLSIFHIYLTSPYLILLKFIVLISSWLLLTYLTWSKPIFPYINLLSTYIFHRILQPGQLGCCCINMYII